jgi:ketosteroid isomerase-like protein
MVTASNEYERLYLEFFATLSGGDLEKIRATFHDDAVWQVQVKGILGEGAHRGKKAIVDEFLAPVRGLFKPGDPKVTVTAMASRGALVIGESVSRGTFVDGRSLREPVRLRHRVQGRQGASPARVHGQPVHRQAAGVGEMKSTTDTPSGMDASRLQHLMAVMKDDIERDRYFGGVIAIGRHGQLALHEPLAMRTRRARVPSGRTPCSASSPRPRRSR